MVAAVAVCPRRQEVIHREPGTGRYCLAPLAAVAVVAVETAAIQIGGLGTAPGVVASQVPAVPGIEPMTSIAVAVVDVAAVP